MYIYIHGTIHKICWKELFIELTLTAAHSWMVRSPRLLETYRKLRPSRSNSSKWVGERWEIRKSQWQDGFWPLKCAFCSHRETFDRQKMDIRSLTQEHQANKRALDPKVLLVWRDSSLANNDSDIRLAILVLFFSLFLPFFSSSSLFLPPIYTLLSHPLLCSIIPMVSRSLYLPPLPRNVPSPTRRGTSSPCRVHWLLFRQS